MNQLSLSRKRAAWIFVGVAIVALLISFVGLLITYIKGFNAPTFERLQEDEKPQLLARLREEGIGVSAPTASNEVKPVDVKVKEPERSAAEVAIINDWFKQAGYSPETEKAYSSYSDQVLEDLIARGDIIAMAVMSSRKLESEGPAAARPYSEKGIIYGSLASIKSVSIYTAPSIVGGGAYDDAKAQLKESLAYLSLLAIRGDSYNASLSKDIELGLFKKNYNVENPLTAADEAWIQNCANALYSYYQTERTKLGLGDFNNETPKEVKAFFGTK